MAKLVDQSAAVLRDTLYISVGAAVLSAQQVTTRVRQLAILVHDRMTVCDGHATAFEERVGDILDDVEERLPDPVDEAFARARQLANGARRRVRSTVTTRPAA